MKPLICKHQYIVYNSVNLPTRYSEEPTKINNGILEGINSVIQAVRNRARRFSSVKYFVAMIYMIAGKLNFRLPT